MSKEKIYFFAMIICAIIAIIGLISVIAHTRNVNLGAVIFPAVLTIFFGVQYKIKKER